MAIRAEQDTFLRFLPERFIRARDSASCKAEFLGLAIKVMELEADWLIESTDGTGTAELLDETPAGIPAPPLDSVDTAAEAPVVAVAAKRELCETVLLAARLDSPL
jgi:hypothetical protein